MTKEEQSALSLNLLRAFKRIKAFAQMNVESLNKGLVEGHNIRADLTRIKRSVESVDQILAESDL